ncbi:MAG: coenzyme F420-0:L-glutamate ligase [Firmicutes bacterium]|nr:coenzyme F420-0:L-glutamate ligase [Bacillota bacterium]
MTKTLGTVSMGIRAPVIREGDNIVELVTDSLLTAVKENKLKLQDNDIVSVTEAVVARAQGNYASLDQIAADVKGKFGDKTVGLVFPILSRNRFALVLKGIARGVKKLVVQLSYPSDEVGNHLVTLDMLDEKGINPYTQSFTFDEFKKIFPDAKHIFTGVDYIEFYKALGDNIEIVLSNDPCYILNHAKNIICADIHSRKRTAKLLTKSGAEKVCDLTNILNESVNGSGYQPDYGLLGSNFASSEKVKLFPRDAKGFVLALQENILKKTGKKLECMVYGDGAFKDPIGGIWELADPVVSPGFTKGLEGQPNEIKLKYVADNDLANLNAKDATAEIKKMIAAKKKIEKTDAVALGTTPRRFVDLVGSLSDLTSGSGDKGTPIILIQNYFKNYAE